MWNRQLWFVFTYLFIDLISFTIILPWLPTIVERLCSEDHILNSLRSFIYTRLLKIDNYQELSRRDATFIGGITSSLMSLAQFAFSATAGALSDSFGRKPVLLGLHCLGILSYLMWAGAGASFTWFLLSRIISGLSRTNLGCISAMVSDLSERESRTRSMAAVGVAYSLAYLIGPPLSGSLIGRLFSKEKGMGVLGPHLGFCAALLSSCNLIHFLAFRETVKPIKSEEQKTTVSSPGPARNALKLLNPRELFEFRDTLSLPDRKKLQTMALVYFLNMLLFSGLECSLLFLAQLRFGYTSYEQGRIFLFIGVMMILIQGGFVGRFKVGREAKTACWAMYIQVVAFLVLAVNGNQIVFYAGILLYTFTSASFVPAFNGLVSLEAESHQQGKILGTFRSLNALGRATGPGLVGFLIWLFNPTISFTIGAICTALVASLFQRRIHPLQAT